MGPLAETLKGSFQEIYKKLNERIEVLVFLKQMKFEQKTNH